MHIEGVDPWEEMQHYITRKDDKGRVWGPDQAIDRPTALRMKTVWAARYINEDHNLGTIEKGKRADMAVLGADFLTVPADNVGCAEDFFGIQHIGFIIDDVEALIGPYRGMATEDEEPAQGVN